MLFSRLLSLICLVGLVYGIDPILPHDEVEALRAIARTLRKSDWNFSVDPCSGSSGWMTQDLLDENGISCDCSFENNTVCHVMSIILKSQNLKGSLPREIVRLPFLRDIILNRNYLNGTIPREWGSTSLMTISLLGNRVTGYIPTELANISTLTSLNIESNELSGTIPPELGSLPLEKLILTSNNLTGVLPASLANLSALKDLRIGDNNFRGSIPNFIQNWTKIEKLIIQGSGLAGPIPTGIASLKRLIDLRISDLTENDSAFPQLTNCSKLRTLILRSCNIVGELPSYIGEMMPLRNIDLSFNKLSGPIPDSLIDQARAENIYLTGNKLSGLLPDWMVAAGNHVDLSYNNLSSANSSLGCYRHSVNLFASSKGNTSGIVSCLGISKCTQEYYSFHINCGGTQFTDNKGTTYEEDTDMGRRSDFATSKTNWALSSTGHFLDDFRPSASYTWPNSSAISGENPQLYTYARLSPLSLSYYGFCLRNGNYTVKLHFAEIMFTDDGTYYSLGRRLFNVYIQGKLVLKDFNIASEAGGVNKAIVRNFTAAVTDNSLDIRFSWAGKGTTSIPSRGVYGPLISAISVDPDYTPPENRHGHISTLILVGLLLGVLFTFLLVWASYRWKCYCRHKDQVHNDVTGLQGSFTLRQIKAATNNFDSANKIGEGGFGPVYKGTLSDGTIVAVKQLSSKSNQGNHEFVNEVGMITSLQHPNIVKQHGCCIEGNQLLLIYEYMENNSLARSLFGPEEHQMHLDWPARHNICIGIAKGLAYLHEESRLKIVHRDIKASNVLLDKHLLPKISDFGLARLHEENNTHMSTRIAGTYGYMAPEYAMRGHLSDKADVYSFGVVLLEIISGRSNTSGKYDLYLLDMANTLKEEGKLIELVDSRLGSTFNREEVLTTIHLGLLCTNVVAAERPAMSSAVSILEGTVSLQEYVIKSDFSILRVKENIPTQTETANVVGGGQSISNAQRLSMSSSTGSTIELYSNPVDLEYWEKRET